jgi:hypothetical protein
MHLFFSVPNGIETESSSGLVIGVRHDYREIYIQRAEELEFLT